MTEIFLFPVSKYHLERFPLCWGSLAVPVKHPPHLTQGHTRGCSDPESWEEIHSWGPLGSNEFCFPFLFSDQCLGTSLSLLLPLKEFDYSFLFSPQKLSAPYFYFRIFTHLMCLSHSPCLSWGDMLSRTLCVLQW